MKVDEETGEVLWSNRIASSGENHESSHDLVVAADDEIYIAGRGFNDPHGEDMIIIRLNGQTGDVVWDRFIGGNGELEDRAWSITLATDGNPVVTGVTSNSVSSADFLTVKLDADDGGTIWSVSKLGAYLDTIDYGWLIPCANGDVIMANNYWRSGQGYNIILERYAGADGSQVWTSEFDSPDSASDRIVQMIADETGNPVVVGVSDGDILTARFNAVNGDLFWTAVFDGPVGWYDSAKCVTLGRKGSIVTGGYVNGGDTSWDAIVIGYSLEDGTELWHHVYDGADSQSDEIRGLSYADGHLYPVGYSYSSVDEMDFMTLYYYEEEGTAVPENWANGASPVAWPNPFVNDTRVTFSLADRGQLQAEVYDLRGRLVRVLADREAAAGEHPVIWDGCDEEGRSMATGVYFVRGRCGTARFSTRVLRLR
ncbi:MAG: PQQ-binding-like beta-propeller repeat protein [bacterium]|nr:PQQ-binding-like beta-propeller repeat protein [bacterium]